MIKEKYVNLEIAKLLKEKGFDCACNVWYSEYTSLFGGEKYTGIEFDDHNKFNENYKFICSAPTLQMAVDWLLEVHHYYIQVMLDSWAYGGRLGYYGLIIKTDSNFDLMLQDVCDKVFYDKPEDVYNDAIKYILENLI